MHLEKSNTEAQIRDLKKMIELGHHESATHEARFRDIKKLIEINQQDKVYET